MRLACWLSVLSCVSCTSAGEDLFLRGTAPPGDGSLPDGLESDAPAGPDGPGADAGHAECEPGEARGCVCVGTMTNSFETCLPDMSGFGPCACSSDPCDVPTVHAADCTGGSCGQPEWLDGTWCSPCEACDGSAVTLRASDVAVVLPESPGFEKCPRACGGSTISFAAIVPWEYGGHRHCTRFTAMGGRSFAVMPGAIGTVECASAAACLVVNAALNAGGGTRVAVLGEPGASAAWIRLETWDEDASGPCPYTCP